MFFSPSAIIAFFFTLFLVGQAAAVPLPAMDALEGNLKRQTPDVQEAAKSDGNGVVAYKRQTPDVEVPAKSDGNVVVAYKRQGEIPVQDAAKSDGNVVTTYKRAPEIPSQMAVRSVNGVIELY